MEKNTIEDQKYYYLFRALNKGDHADIEAGITADENGINKIRTDGERFKEINGKVKYGQNSEISLEETWEHIKCNHSLETNCISLSSDANVSISYGGEYFHEYVMIKVPKTGRVKVYNAGDYMLDEMDKRLKQVIVKMSKESKILSIINQIENADSSSQVRELLSNSYTIVRSFGKYVKVNKNFKLLHPVTKRLQNKQYFNIEQQLRYNKIIAKLTVLELYQKIGSILPTQRDNNSLILTIESAYLSAELLHYKTIEKEELVSVSKEMIDMISLLQQLKYNGVENLATRTLESELIRLVKERYTLKKEQGNTILTNEKNSIVLDNVKFDIINQSFEQAEHVNEKLKISRQRALEYTKVIMQILGKTPGSDEIEMMLKERAFTIDKDIVTRENGIRISNSINIKTNNKEVI